MKKKKEKKKRVLIIYNNINLHVRSKKVSAYILKKILRREREKHLFGFTQQWKASDVKSTLNLPLTCVSYRVSRSFLTKIFIYTFILMCL